MKESDENSFAVNKKVEIIKDNELKFKAEITSKREDGMTLVMGVVYRDLGIKPGRLLQYFFGVNEEKLGLNFYSCYSNITAVDRRAGKLYIGVDYPKEIENLGIRKFYRMPIETEIYYSVIRYLDNYDKLDEVPNKYYSSMKTSKTIDISGNGIKIYVEEFCRKGQDVALVIPNLNYIKLLGTIQWVEPDKFNQKNAIAISFKDLNDNQQDKIVSFIWNSRFLIKNEK